MFEVRLFQGSDPLYTRTCDLGDVLPTAAALMQQFESERGLYEYQRTYAVTWRRVKE